MSIASQILQDRLKPYISLEKVIDALVRHEIQDTPKISEQDIIKAIAEYLYLVLDENDISLYRLYRNQWKPNTDNARMVYVKAFLDGIYAPEIKHPSLYTKWDKEEIAHAGKETGFKITDLSILLHQYGKPEDVYKILTGHKPPKGTFPVIKGTLLTGGVEIKPEQPAPIQGRQSISQQREKPLVTRERNNLLKIIYILSRMNRAIDIGGADAVSAVMTKAGLLEEIQNAPGDKLSDELIRTRFDDVCRLLQIENHRKSKKNPN